MLFHSFKTQDDRRKYGGSAFVELQYCTLKQGTKLKKIVSVRSIDHWKDSSLYVHVDDLDVFASDYREIFQDGIYNNLESGEFDLFGINYYPPETVDFLINKIESKKPFDYIALIEWLKRGKELNGFYILGV